MSLKAIGQLGRLTVRPVPVETLNSQILHTLARHRAIEVRDGIATITPTGLRQFRNLQAVVPKEKPDVHH